jgi:coenzyme F420 hydrogenase subunit beta
MQQSADLDRTRLSIAFTNRDLCARSGTCVGICPEKAISIDDSGYPIIPDPSLCTECGLCARSCPGGSVNYAELAKLTFGADEDLDRFDGRVSSTVVARATDDGIVAGATGGGVITGLLWDLLKSGEVDGCIVTRMRPDQPWKSEPFIARSYEDLLASRGSKYSITPVNTIFQEILDSPGVYAYAALPCQTHGYRKAVQELPRLKEKIHSVIGLFCGGALEPHLVPEMLQMKGLDRSDIRDFQFRGGEWPGKIRAILKDGTIRDMHYSNYKDGAYNYVIGIYMPPRCTTCLDGSGEFADVSVSDVWTRDTNGNFMFKSRSRILVRTELGARIVANAVQRGSISATDVSDDPNYITHRLQTTRKGLNARLRVERLARRGVQVPAYDRKAPAATLREKAMERFISSLLRMGRYRWFRYPVIKFLTSSAAIPLINLRIYVKRRKYRKG